MTYETSGTVQNFFFQFQMLSNTMESIASSEETRVIIWSRTKEDEGVLFPSFDKPSPWKCLLVIIKKKKWACPPYPKFLLPEILSLAILQNLAIFNTLFLHTIAISDTSSQPQIQETYAKEAYL